jgi:hypothetical protein
VCGCTPAEITTISKTFSKPSIKGLRVYICPTLDSSLSTFCLVSDDIYGTKTSFSNYKTEIVEVHIFMTLLTKYELETLYIPLPHTATLLTSTTMGTAGRSRRLRSRVAWRPTRLTCSTSRCGAPIALLARFGMSSREAPIHCNGPIRSTARGIKRAARCGDFVSKTKMGMPPMCAVSLCAFLYGNGNVVTV